MARDLLLADTLNWGELLEQALRHKMVPMLAHHIISAGLRFDVPTSIYQHLESALEWNRCQIEVFRREAVRVAQGLAARVFPSWSPRVWRSIDALRQSRHETHE